MKIGLAQILSTELKDKIPLLTEVSNLLQQVFAEKNFGEDLLDLTVGVICGDPGFDQFFKLHKKYYPGKKDITYEGLTTSVENALEYNIKLPFVEFKEMEYNQAKAYLIWVIYNSLDKIGEVKKIREFDLEGFKIHFREKLLTNHA